MNKFELVSKFKPTGDQPKAIEKLVDGLNDGLKQQVLLGATGTGKTFTIANVIEQVNRPTLVFSHNKTLAGQLYAEFKELFPNNRVEYFVSNFDFYQPEAYMPRTDTYIEKTASINDELDMLRMAAVNSVLERRDTIIVASVACIYASSDPNQYRDMFFAIRLGEEIDRKELLMKLVDRQYRRNDMEQTRGTFRVRGDVIEIVPGHTDEWIIRIEMFGDQIERITEVDVITKKVLNAYTVYIIYPATGYAREREKMIEATYGIEAELKDRLEYFEKEGKLLEKERLEQRCLYDIESLREFGFCSGIENYSMYIDGRKPGDRPFNLFDYFPDDFLLVVDESHVSLPQIRGMYNGDRSRKETLVNYGFRLPSALENRPMRFHEFEEQTNQVIYCSATPGDYELEKVNHQVVEQIIRPTGLLDPVVEVRPTRGQIDDICDEIDERVLKNERVLITALTVKMAEDLTEYLMHRNYKVQYLHHETKTLERIEVIRDLRLGKIDVIVGINLLREGLDIPEVSLVCILDADKEGFLRSETSLIQTIGRAARNSESKVIMYADVITDSMKRAIDETNRRREIQMDYNKKHGITPKTVAKQIRDIIEISSVSEEGAEYGSMEEALEATVENIEKTLEKYEREMREASKELQFERAAQLRDKIFELRKMKKKINNS
ncbi:MAG TPA: excinuclease ABC subunit B [Erysipelotrichaceae bacterium]|nr:excinuclease ABC subunit B [Erysipelotrichaceae bacterium]